MYAHMTYMVRRSIIPHMYNIICYLMYMYYTCIICIIVTYVCHVLYMPCLHMCSYIMMCICGGLQRYTYRTYIYVYGYIDKYFGIWMCLPKVPFLRVRLVSYTHYTMFSMWVVLRLAQCLLFYPILFKAQTYNIYI